ncbi:Coiled-coil domain-containing protein 77 [Boothiomyces macroporosus]|uniref:Coiled-coil domain-containing protein 77 n=1 Tax=Boothiomyces macroporosus TaxID=261099 RepID=A0AAD5UND5_9FUNG|nr:Coiled-coil domain-containing protein 77 [Boothiomyces macroporosus]
MSPLQEELINYYKQRLVYSLQQALGDFQAAVFEERKHTLAIVAENDALKSNTSLRIVQELKDRKKIRFLLSLSGSPEEEVTYFRDRQGPRLKNKYLVFYKKATYEEAISGLMKERRLREDEEKARRDYEEEKIEALTKKLAQMRLLCRENTKELLRTKKMSHRNEKTLIEEKAMLVDEIKKLNNLLNKEKERNSNQEKTIEERVSKEQQNMVVELNDKNDYEQYRISTDRKIDFYKSKVDAANQNYLALKRRRDYEIEGFTSDIVNLRQQLRTLEKSILKYGALEDKELVLLNIGKSI